MNSSPLIFKMALYALYGRGIGREVSYVYDVLFWQKNIFLIISGIYAEFQARDQTASQRLITKLYYLRIA